MNQFWKDNYNIAAIVCAILGIILCVFFVAADSQDNNLIYYLISVSAIYATIQLGFLLQKVLSIRQQKEHLLTGYNELWEAVTHYRYLCALVTSYLEQSDHHRYRAAKSLKASRIELLVYNFTGDEKDIEKNHFSELQEEMRDHHFNIKYALLVKQAVFFSNDVYKHVNYINRVYANNNQTINLYIKGMLENPVFSLLQEINELPEVEKLYNQIAKHPFYKEFQVKAGFEPDEVSENLVKIERYLLNNVLFKLHDHTFIIEKPLPRPFMHILVNSFTILLCGTILPLFNAFFSASTAFTLICGALTLAALVLSVTYIALTFHDENSEALFRFVPVIYEGKEHEV